MNTAASETSVLKKKKPRTCVGCGEEAPKKLLLRVVRNADGTVSYDPTGKAQGRGAYVCSDPECIKKAAKKKAFLKALRVASEGDIYEILEKAAAEQE